MICNKCGNEIRDDVDFCPKCGNPVKRKQKTSFLEANKKVIVIIAGIVIIAVTVLGTILYNSQSSVKYKKAQKAFEKGKYEKSISLYTKLGDYEDSADKLEEAIIVNHYATGKKLIDESDYDGAISEFAQCADYEDSEDMINLCRYESAKIYKENGEYTRAASLFASTNEYQDSDALIVSMGEELVNDGKFADALEVFEYSEKKGNNPYAAYAQGFVSYEEKDYSVAAASFSGAGDILDAKDRFKEAKYNEANELLNSSKYNEAEIAFKSVSGYQDTDEKIQICKLHVAKNKMEEGYLNQAKSELEALPEGYSNNGVSAKDLLDKINANEKWLAVCGKWTCTSGKMDTKQVGSYGSWSGWNRNLDDSNHVVELRCKIDNSGDVTVVTTGNIPVFTEYSSIQLGLKTGTQSIATTQKVNGYGTIKINDITTLTISDKSISVSYNNVVTNQDVYFTYKYNTDMTYGERTVKY